MNNYLIDMHCHTTVSDGTVTPKDIVHIAKESGLKAIAITDHDTIDGIDEAMKEGEKLGVEIIAGIEFASMYDENTEQEIHILGFLIDCKNDELNKNIEFIQGARDRRNVKMIENLRKLGIDITMEDVEKSAGGDILTRAHFAKVLEEKGYVKTKNEAFSYYLNAGKPAYIRREFLTPKTCIEAINKASGLAFLAHPTLYKMSYEQIEKLLKELKGYGLCGVEAEYSTYTPEQEKNIKKIANKLGLLISGGSDFHGENRSDTKLGVGKGNLKISYDYLQKMKDYKNSRDMA